MARLLLRNGSLWPAEGDLGGTGGQPDVPSASPLREKTPSSFNISREVSPARDEREPVQSLQLPKLSSLRFVMNLRHARSPETRQF